MESTRHRPGRSSFQEYTSQVCLHGRLYSRPWGFLHSGFTFWGALQLEAWAAILVISTDTEKGSRGSGDQCHGLWAGKASRTGDGALA